jgi:hypothetical protein
MEADALTKWPKQTALSAKQGKIKALLQEKDLPRQHFHKNPRENGLA